jgi:hypothetical protein
MHEDDEFGRDLLGGLFAEEDQKARQIAELERELKELKTRSMSQRERTMRTAAIIAQMQALGQRHELAVMDRKAQEKAERQRRKDLRNAKAWGFLLGIFFMFSASMFVRLYGADIQRIAGNINIPAFASGGSTGSSSPCVDVADSFAAGIAQNEQTVKLGNTMLIGVNSRFASTGAPAWGGKPHGGTDIWGRHLTEVRLPVAMTFAKGGTYTEDGIYGDYRQFGWKTPDGREIIWYFGHLENARQFEQGREYPAGTVIGFMTDGGPYSASWGQIHTHIQGEYLGAMDGYGDIDFEVWWRQNCSGSVTKGGDVDVDTNATDFRLFGPPTVSAATIDEILAARGSPAAGTGQIWFDEYTRWGIDPVFALAKFEQESNMGTAGAAWAGYKGEGSYTCNVGNVKLPTSVAPMYNSHSDFSGYGEKCWEEGIKASARLLSCYFDNKSDDGTLLDHCNGYWDGAELSMDPPEQAYERAVQRWAEDWQPHLTVARREIPKWREMERQRSS